MCVYVFEFHDKKSDKWKFIAAMLERLVVPQHNNLVEEDSAWGFFVLLVVG